MKKILIREEVCFACHLCEVYCKLHHSKSKDLIKAFKKESPPPMACLVIEERRPISFSIQCRQCSEPSCVYSCLTGALQRNPDTGIITTDETRCIGCWTCILNCPFGVIKQDINHHKAIKCDLCQGEETPACVANCPNEALVYADAAE